MQCSKAFFRLETDTVSRIHGSLLSRLHDSRAVTSPDVWYGRNRMHNFERPPVTRFVHRGRPDLASGARAQNHFGSPRDELIVERGITERSPDRSRPGCMPDTGWIGLPCFECTKNGFERPSRPLPSLHVNPSTQLVRYVDASLPSSPPLPRRPPPPNISRPRLVSRA